MASVSSDGGGRKRILFVDGDGNRPAIRLGKATKSQANKFKDKVEALIAGKITGAPVEDEVSNWVAALPDTMHARLVAVGLVKARQAMAVATLRKLHDEFFAALNVKPGTHAAYKQGADSLLTHFGETKPLPEIDALAIDKWLQSLRAEKLAEATVAKRTQTAKRMFRQAVRWKMVAESPLEDVEIGSQKNKARQFFITRDVAQKVLDACPDAQWRLLFALSRYGGLRCPSEHLALKWGDIDFEHDRILVRSPKTEHHKGKDTRLMPLFSELRKPLLDVYAEAEPGTEYVITRYRNANSNLRTHLERIMVRAGVDSWPRLFQNLRASRATELAAEFPSHVAAAWLGHSEEIADAHYRQVLDGDFAKAIAGPSNQAAQNPAQSTPDKAGQTRTTENEPSENHSEKQENPPAFAMAGDSENEPHGRGRIRTFEGRAIRFTI
jgi:integrase